jgi:hypothetical protein
MKWANVTRKGEMRAKILVGKYKGNGTFGRPRN